VILNAGIGIYVYGFANSISEGVDKARAALYSGKAERKLQQWIDVSTKIKQSA
jgi:anthranilate phosphoribosyltransferase